jgi:elongation factor 1 alpha-like protein
MHKYEKMSIEYGKGSFKFAWVMDEGEEERKRGVTIDVGQSFFETKNRQFTILDAPGH